VVWGVAELAGAEVLLPREVFDLVYHRKKKEKLNYYFFFNLLLSVVIKLKRIT
jgi:hypothetical protein